MEQYRKPDQYYNDQYDRITIERLKELESQIREAQQKFNIETSNTDKIPTEAFARNMVYLDTGVKFARDKKHTIDEWIRVDERKDRLISLSRIPTDVTCNTCGGPMRFELHDFVNEDADLIFFFSCPKGHMPKKALYASGQERYLKRRQCSYCGGDLTSKTKKSKNKMTITDTCRVCDNVDVFEYDATPKKILAIDEAERKKYCTDFIGRRSFDDDLKAIADFARIYEEQESKAKYDFSKVQQLNIAQLEKTLTEQIEKAGFIKVLFDKPKTGRYLIVEFSAQDPADRDEKNSLKELKKIINTTLFTTNWRLRAPGIEYKLGFLNGQLKGCSLDEDLLKIAEEIAKKKES
jgi:hypothetical protein